MNYFDYLSAAERYRKGRPYFHPGVVGMVRSRLCLTSPLSLALDVGCGTGLSTMALTEIAHQVVGVDPSPAMLSQAPRAEHMDYALAPAEHLPLRSATVDLITVSAAFHWLDRSAFLAEAWRVLNKGGWLVVYSYAFSGQMQEDPAFEVWMREVYRSRYPKTPRAPVDFSAEDSLKGGFVYGGREDFQTPVRFTVEALVDYLVTHSNVIAMVEGGGERIQDVRRWLIEEITPFYNGRVNASVLFRGPIWYLQKAE